MEEKKYTLNIPESDKPRLVIIGGGVAGLKLVRFYISPDSFRYINN